MSGVSSVRFHISVIAEQWRVFEVNIKSITCLLIADVMLTVSTKGLCRFFFVSWQIWGRKSTFNDKLATRARSFAEWRQRGPLPVWDQMRQLQLHVCMKLLKMILYHKISYWFFVGIWPHHGLLTLWKAWLRGSFAKPRAIVFRTAIMAEYLVSEPTRMVMTNIQ